MATNLLPAPYLNLFCLMSPPGSPCPLHFSISVGQSRNYRLLVLHIPANIYGLFCVSLHYHSLKFLQILSELKVCHSTILAQVNSQGTKFPKLSGLFLFSRSSFSSEGLSCAGCGDRTTLPRLLWHRDLPGLSLTHVSVIFTFCPPQKWDLFLWRWVLVFWKSSHSHLFSHLKSFKF